MPRIGGGEGTGVGDRGLNARWTVPAGCLPVDACPVTAEEEAVTEPAEGEPAEETTTTLLERWTAAEVAWEAATGGGLPSFADRWPLHTASAAVVDVAVVNDDTTDAGAEGADLAEPTINFPARGYEVAEDPAAPPYPIPYGTGGGGVPGEPLEAKVFIADAAAVATSVVAALGGFFGLAVFL